MTMPIINRAAIGRRDSCSARGLFLVLSLTRGRPLLGQVVVGSLNHATCMVYLPKGFETLVDENVGDIIFFIIKYIVVCFYRGVRFEARNVTERARVTSLTGNINCSTKNSRV